MTAGKRTFLALAAAGLLLIGLAVGMGPRPREPASGPEIAEAAPALSTALSPAASPRAYAVAAGSGAATVVRPPPRADGTVTPECEACRNKECTNYQNSGVDLLSGCFKAIDPGQGADGLDQRFLDDCAALVRCATRTGCANGPRGASACYCGPSVENDACIEHGPGPDAPCLEEFRRASRSQRHEDITLRFSDLKYPSGWAAALIACEQHECKSQCSG